VGTSSSQRSPATPEWERVRELYRQPNPEPGQIAGRIVQALSPQTRQAMADRGVAICLDTMLVGSKEVADQGLKQLLLSAGLPPEGPAAVSVAAALRSRAQQRLVERSAASRFAELALDGLAVATMEAASAGQSARLTSIPFEQAERALASYVRDDRLHELSGTFLAYDLDRAFRYFVSRDLSDFVGTQAFPTVGEAQRLLDDVAAYCRSTVRELPLADAEPLLQDALRAPEPQRLLQVHGFLQQAMSLGLDTLGAAGGVL